MKRAKELRGLSDDHHRGLVLARRCQRVGSQGDEFSTQTVWREVLEAFNDHLEPHFQIEEQYLLPALEAMGETLLVKRIQEDHQVLRVMSASETVSPDLVNRFGKLLQSHIRFEERQVFESIQHRLPLPTLQAIAVACTADE